jgi:hypothetical protein
LVGHSNEYMELRKYLPCMNIKSCFEHLKTAGSKGRCFEL